MDSLPRTKTVARAAAAQFAQGAPLLECLHGIQDELGFLAHDALEEFAFESRLAREQVWSAASFYSNFRVEPAPAVEIRVCTSLSCHLSGSADLKSRVELLSAKSPSELAARGTACLGMCDRAPACLVNGSDVGHAGSLDLASLVTPPRTATPRYEPMEAYRRRGGYALLSRLSNGFDPRDAIRSLAASGLRGMGGAGFPAGKKWEFVANAPGDTKFVIVNADEGEPGTFKDRWILEKRPHEMLEGMLVAMLAVGADEGWIYLREEYAEARKILEACLAELREARLLDTPMKNGKTLRARIVVGAGSYVCGEETALLESIEGRRGEPRLKPPFPAQFGLFGKPTLIQNVETLYWVPRAVKDPDR